MLEEWHDDEIWSPTDCKLWPNAAYALRSLCAKKAGDPTFDLRHTSISHLNDRLTPACLLILATELQGVAQLDISGQKDVTAER
eukprot:6469275-Prymnesium_polylepis.1